MLKKSKMKQRGCLRWDLGISKNGFKLLAWYKFCGIDRTKSYMLRFFKTASFRIQISRNCEHSHIAITATLHNNIHENSCYYYLYIIGLVCKLERYQIGTCCKLFPGNRILHYGEDLKTLLLVKLATVFVVCGILRALAHARFAVIWERF